MAKWIISRTGYRLVSDVTYCDLPHHWIEGVSHISTRASYHRRGYKPYLEMNAIYDAAIHTMICEFE